jgi:hypothetical protein
MALRLPLVVALIAFYCGSSHAFTVNPHPLPSRSSAESISRTFLSSDDWSSFAALEDVDDDEDTWIDTNTYAKEEDSQELKAEIGSSRPAPSIEFPAPPIRVPAGMLWTNGD